MDRAVGYLLLGGESLCTLQEPLLLAHRFRMTPTHLRDDLIRLEEKPPDLAVPRYAPMKQERRSRVEEWTWVG